jgi:Ca2+-binding RTX toxin-like protein
MRGGTGSDTFLFYRNLANAIDSGSDKILDFVSGEDKLEIDTTMVSDFVDAAGFIANHYTALLNGQSIVTFDAGASVTLNTALVEADFLFV